MKGMIQWLTKSKRKSIVRRSSRFWLYPSDIGNHHQLEAEYERDERSPSHMYGVAVRT